MQVYKTSIAIEYGNKVPNTLVSDRLWLNCDALSSTESRPLFGIYTVTSKYNTPKFVSYSINSSLLSQNSTYKFERL